MSGEASLVVKGVVYSLTIALLLYATYCEQKLKDYLIDEADQDTNVIDSGIIAEQFRRARVTGNGTYLVSYLTMNCVIEYDKNFNPIWRYNILSPWAALRLKNGNTLITDEKEWLTREVNSKGETVWEFNCKKDLPEAYQLLSAPQTVTRLANGNTVFTSRGKSGSGPQLIEVTSDKKVVWVLRDWKNIGDATAVQVLDDPGVPEVPGQSEH